MKIINVLYVKIVDRNDTGYLDSHIENRILQNHLQYLMGLENSHSKLEENN